MICVSQRSGIRLLRFVRAGARRANAQFRAARPDAPALRGRPGALPDKLAIIHEHDTIGDLAREPPFVRHDDHGDSRFPEMNMLPEMLAA